VESLVKSYDHFSPVWKDLLAYALSRCFHAFELTYAYTDRLGKDVAVWQMRDLNPLKTWVKGRAILIGDAAHPSAYRPHPFIDRSRLTTSFPVLPHQAAGAMSAIEDAEAIAAYLRGSTADAKSVHDALTQVFRVRFKRTAECQALSRAHNILHLRTGADLSSKILEMWVYSGAERWAAERPDMVLDG
jgi:2-polyprenyl-6-methoxyphenol hydroxylase-like FAD-dependent oxidoreductase